MRKRNSSRRVLGAALAVLALAGCDFISPVESNPNAVPEATVDQLFVSAQLNLYFFAEGQLSRLSSMWVQQMTGTDRQFVGLDNYIIDETDADDDFDRVYTQGGLIDIRRAIALAEADGRRPYAGILKILEAYLVGMAASYWGDIPYSEAVNPAIRTPVLDDQAAVYAAVQALLDAAIADLAATGSGPGSVDLWFGGNAARWTAVARTLKARFYMHWGEVQGNAAYTQARTHALQGISTAAGTWKAQHTTASTENNLWYQFMRDRSGYISAGDFLVPLMVSTSDPRISRYFSQVGGNYVARSSSLASTGWGAPDFDFPIVSCAENQFILAEAEYRLGNTAAARTAASNALACEEAEYGVSLATQRTRVTDPLITGSALLNEILRQKYIAMFLNPEALNDYKRTCQPGFTPRAGGVPPRLFYSGTERQTNPNIPNPQPARNDNDPNPCP
jgi:hypothetical protein